MSVRRLICLLFLFLLLAAPVNATGPIRILTEEYPPFNYQEYGMIGGISTVIVEAAFKRAGVEYYIELMPWKRAVFETLSKPNTFLYTMALTEKRKDKFIWVGKLFQRKVSLYRLRKRTDLDKYSLDEARDKLKICAVDGDASLELLREKGFVERNIIKLSPSTRLLCPKMVEEGHADLTPFNPFGMGQLVRTGELPDEFVEHSVLLNEGGYYLTTNLKTDPALVTKLQKAFKELAAEGLNQKVFEEYLK